MVVAAVSTALSVVREKERETIEQIMVSPVKPWELMLGKILPFVLISFWNVGVATAIGLLWFRIEFNGSYLLLLALSVVFLVGCEEDLLPCAGIQGEARDLSGPDLDLVSDAEGTTGFISRVTLKVRPLEDLGLTAIACPDAHKLTTVFKEFISRNLPIWSVVFINPRMAEMKNRAPVRTHQGHPAGHKVILPAASFTTLLGHHSP